MEDAQVGLDHQGISIPLKNNENIYSGGLNTEHCNLEGFEALNLIGLILEWSVIVKYMLPFYMLPFDRLAKSLG